MYETVLFEKKGEVGILTLNRPNAMNAINSQLIHDVLACLDEVEADPELRALIITGCGRAFGAGADIAQMQSMSMMEGRAFAQYGCSMMNRVARLRIPVIAAVNGFALGGGCELALSCDVVLASEKAKFGQPEVCIGVTPGFSGTQRLSRRIGIAAAKELIFSGKMIDVREAERLGIVNHVYAPEELMDAAMEMAKSFAKNAPIAVALSKACINNGLETDLTDGISYENEAFGMCFSTEDQKNGMAAFLAKSEATFQNR